MKIPNTVQGGRITAENHTVYSESNIVGSTLPILHRPAAPPTDYCAVVGPIIALAVIAVVVSVITAGAAAPVGALIFGAGLTGSAAVGAAVVGGIIVGLLSLLAPLVPVALLGLLVWAIYRITQRRPTPTF